MSVYECKYMHVICGRTMSPSTMLIWLHGIGLSSRTQRQTKVTQQHQISVCSKTAQRYHDEQNKKTPKNIWIWDMVTCDQSWILFQNRLSHIISTHISPYQSISGSRETVVFFAWRNQYTFAANPVAIGIPAVPGTPFVSAAAMPAPPASTPANAGPVASAQDSIAPAASDQDAGASGPDAGASGPIGRRSWTKSMAPQNAKFAGNELEVAPVVMTSMFAPPNTTCPGSTICEVCHGPRHRRGQPRSGHALGRRKTGPSLCLRVFFPNQEPPPWARGGGKSPAADPEPQHCGFAREWQGSRSPAAKVALCLFF